MTKRQPRPEPVFAKYTLRHEPAIHRMLHADRADALRLGLRIAAKRAEYERRLRAVEKGER